MANAYILAMEALSQEGIGVDLELWRSIIGLRNALLPALAVCRGQAVCLLDLRELPRGRVACKPGC